MGVTVCVAAGDNGSADGVADGKAHVDFPASSPFALACGGTKLAGIGHERSRSEIVWNENATSSATGGGVSDFFAAARVPGRAPASRVGEPRGSKAGRGVPDVAGDADPDTGYQVRVDGQDDGDRRHQRRRAALGGADRAA